MQPPSSLEESSASQVAAYSQGEGKRLLMSVRRKKQKGKIINPHRCNVQKTWRKYQQKYEDCETKTSKAEGGVGESEGMKGNIMVPLIKMMHVNLMSHLGKICQVLRKAEPGCYRK